MLKNTAEVVRRFANQHHLSGLTGLAPHLRVGTRGERLARKHLKERGYFIWKTNWTCPDGELDIVALKKGILCFVEVKTRTNPEGTGYDPIAAVNLKKQTQIKKLSRKFRKKHHAEIKARRVREIRFDIIAISCYGSSWKKDTVVEFFEGAY